MASLLGRTTLCKTRQLLKVAGQAGNIGGAGSRRAVTKPSGAFLPEPTKEAFGLVGFTATVVIGLGLGATISKHFASFLEENELFVPSDDDDDD